MALSAPAPCLRSSGHASSSHLPATTQGQGFPARGIITGRRSSSPSLRRLKIQQRGSSGGSSRAAPRLPQRVEAQVGSTSTAPEAALEEQVEASPEFRAQALVSSTDQYQELYRRSVEDPDGFWANIARTFHWETEFPAGPDGRVHEENLDVRKGPVFARWFAGGRTNVCYNALDRWVAQGAGARRAFIWEGNDPGRTRTLSYLDLLQGVAELAETLRRLGVGKGDFVTIYMPMLPELPMAMLACARIGAVHSVVFGGFSSEALAQRIQDCSSKVILTASAVMRGTKRIPLKGITDDALALCPPDLAVKCLVYHNANAGSREDTTWTEGRDLWWQDHVVGPTDTLAAWNALASETGGSAAATIAEYSPVEWTDAEDPLFLLYTSGSTGKPKGVLHTTGGYMVYTATTFKYAFDYKPDDVYWCTADCGWITGHSYVAYGPLLNGATQVLFEGVPSYPDWGRCWQIVDNHRVSLFYTAPTAIRAAMSAGDELVRRHSRASLRVLGSVGEPINPAAWRWYFQVVGDGRCPISDTWWQTETGGFMITPLPGAWPQRPGSATFPFFGVQPAIVDEKGQELQGEASGYLCMKASWPSMFRTLYGDHPRFETTYFAPFNGFYFSGDGCRRDADGYYWLTGRVDDVINVSGHRIGTAEVESALVAHPSCSEAAVVGYDHAIKGQGIYAYVTLMSGTEPSEELRLSLIKTVRLTIGAFAAPDKIHWAPGLPKTRSGKIMRRVLRKIAVREEDQLGDISTLAEPGVVAELIKLRPK